MHVERFKYLECESVHNLDPIAEIKRKVSAVKTAFKKLSTLLCLKSLNLKIRQTLVRCYVRQTILGGIEIWTT